MKTRYTQICDIFYMVKAAICVKMTEYKSVQNAGISLTKGACVTLSEFIYISVYISIQGHFQTICIADMGPRPHKNDERKEVRGGTECRL